MRIDPARIEAALAVLKGLPLSASHRAADLQCFQFGVLRETVRTAGRWKGHAVLEAEWNLHVQCSWRITGPEGILVGRRDLYYRAGDDPLRDLDDFDHDKEPNRRSERVARFFDEREPASLRVRGIHTDQFGGFRLELGDGHALEVWPDDSMDDEYWRVFKPEHLDSHFVVTGEGIES